MNPAELDVPVIGGHSVTILPLLSQVNAEFSAEETAALTDRIQNAGTEVVDAKAGGGSATLSMGQAALKFTLSLAKALQGESVTECAYVEVEGMDSTFFALPVVLGKDGIESIPALPELNDFEKEKMAELMPTLNSNIQKGVEFAGA